MSEPNKPEHQGGDEVCGCQKRFADQICNIGRVHYAVCHTHRYYWEIGGNLFSHWREETEDDWRRNAEILALYSEVPDWECAAPAATDPSPAPDVPADVPMGPAPTDYPEFCDDLEVRARQVEAGDALSRALLTEMAQAAGIPDAPIAAVSWATLVDLINREVGTE